jgi:hypothetical protein
MTLLQECSVNRNGKTILRDGEIQLVKDVMKLRPL